MMIHNDNPRMCQAAAITDGATASACARRHRAAPRQRGFPSNLIMDRLSMYTTALFLVDRAYGGPEEGGWYYDTGEPVSDVQDRRFLPKSFMTESAAIRHSQKIQPLVDATLNEGRYDINSVLSEGQYRMVVCDGLPAPYPQTRPHYE